MGGTAIKNARNCLNFKSSAINPSHLPWRFLATEPSGNLDLKVFRNLSRVCNEPDPKPIFSTGPSRSRSFANIRRASRGCPLHFVQPGWALDRLRF